MLDEKEFKEKVRLATLVSFDLLIFDEKGRLLLGLRKNKPAKDFLFVPGASIWKGETFKTAMKRISKSELGIELELGDVECLGTYEHFYEDNFGDGDFGTHYICHAFRYHLKENEKIDSGGLMDQHEGIFWLSPEEIKEHGKVHQNVKNYFLKKASNRLESWCR